VVLDHQPFLGQRTQHATFVAARDCAAGLAQQVEHFLLACGQFRLVHLVS
jgi:hypothetical protein